MAKKKAKVSKWTWGQIEGIEDLPNANVDFIRILLLHCRTIPVGLETFFRLNLAPYYDTVTPTGLSNEAGFVIYRLSDLVPQKRRETIEIYPRDESSWYTLEEWRDEFGAELQIPEIRGTAPRLPDDY